MKRKLTGIFLLILLSLTVSGQTLNPSFDSLLAKRLGADDYGMKSYILVILKTGSYTNAGKAFTDSCFAGHMQNINRLAEEKKLVVAGPLGKNEQSYRGIFILDTPHQDEASKWVQTDPAVSSGLLDPLYFKWYGSAALPEYLEVSEKINRFDF